jgi:cyclophilin family peptidyl-prolyl cis-trans isomerase
MKPIFFTILCWCLLLGESLFANSVVRFSSNVGDIDMELFDTETPATVANFLFYVNAGRYNQSFIHRSVPGFVIQGGGFGLSGNEVLPVPTNAAVQNEPGIPNLRGTVAMAKLGLSPDSATSQWFINLKDNSENLDAQNGGFTVFGRVVGNGMAVADRIAAFATYNATADLGEAFGALPLQSASLTINNLILFSTVRALPAGAKPSLTWSTPPAIAYGTALGASQLNATSNIAGNLTYTLPAGTVLAAGNHTLSVTFTPTDSGNYTTASLDVSIQVISSPAVFVPSIGGGSAPASSVVAAPGKAKKGKGSKKISSSKSKPAAGSPSKKSSAKKSKKK